MDISAVKQKIEALAAEVSPNAVTPPMVANIMTDLADMLGETRSVMDVDVLRRDDGICLEFAIMNNETGKQDIVNVVLPAAEPTMAGLMSAEDKANADTLKTWYDAVSGNNVVTDIFYDAPTGGTANVCLKVQSFGRTGASAKHSVFLPSATAVRAGIMTADDKRKLDALDSMPSDANPTISDARLRLRATPFRIHGDGLLTTDEVRLYRCVKSQSKCTSNDDIRKPVQGWHRLTSFNRSSSGAIQYRITTHLQAPTDISENSPWSKEVEVTVDVQKLSDGSWTAVDTGIDLQTFFAKHFLSFTDNGLNIQNGRKTKNIPINESGGIYPSARTVEWALRVFRDGKPVTDMLPWKWLVEVKQPITADDIEAGTPYDCGKINVVSIPLQTSAGLQKVESGGGGETPSVELPDVDVLKGFSEVKFYSEDIFAFFSGYNLKTGKVSTASPFMALQPATTSKAGIMTAEMFRKLETLYDDYLKRTSSANAQKLDAD